MPRARPTIRPLAHRRSGARPARIQAGFERAGHGPGAPTSVASARSGGVWAHGALPRWGAPAPPALEGPDQPLDPLVVGLERVLAENGLALRVVELEIDPVHPVVLALQVRPPDELAAEPGARSLGWRVLGLLDLIVAHQPVDAVVSRQEIVDALEGADVVVLEVDQGNPGVAPRQAVAHHVLLDPLPLDDPVDLPVALGWV